MRLPRPARRPPDDHHTAGLAARANRLPAEEEGSTAPGSLAARAGRGLRGADPPPLGPLERGAPVPATIGAQHGTRRAAHHA